MNKQLEQLQKQYESVTIPHQLDDIIMKTIAQHKANKKRLFWKKWSMGSVAALVLLLASINISPVMAKSLANIPLLGEVVDVLTWKSYRVDHGQMTADIDIPAIQSENKQGIVAELNEKYRQEAEVLHDQFMLELKDMEQMGEQGYLGLYSGYEVITDTEQLLSIARRTTETMASSYETIKYDTIDKKNGLLITLPSLFKDDQYIAAISNYIIEQMKTEMQASNTDVVYWVAGAGLSNEASYNLFSSIQPDQGFYITENGKLVISFDEYEVAPGYMGTPLFEIPSELLVDMLVSDTYIN